MYLTQQGVGGASVLPRAKVLEYGKCGPRLRLGELRLEFPKGLCGQRASARRLERHPEPDELAERYVEMLPRHRYLARCKGAAEETFAMGHHNAATRSAAQFGEFASSLCRGFDPAPWIEGCLQFHLGPVP